MVGSRATGRQVLEQQLSAHTLIYKKEVERQRGGELKASSSTKVSP